MLAAGNYLISKIKISCPYSTSHQASLFFAAEKKIGTHLIWPSWGLVFDKLPKASHEAPTSFHLWLHRVTQKLMMHTSIWELFASWSLHNFTRVGRYHKWSLAGLIRMGILFLKRCEQTQGPWFCHVITQLRFLFHSGVFIRAEHRSRGVPIRTRFQNGVSLSSATKQRFSSWQKQICHSG